MRGDASGPRIAAIGAAVVLHIACLAMLSAAKPDARPSEPSWERRVEVLTLPVPDTALPLLKLAANAAEAPVETAANMPPPPSATTPTPEPAPAPLPLQAEAVPPVNATALPEAEQPDVRFPPPVPVRQPVRHRAPPPTATRQQDVTAPAKPEPQRLAAAAPPPAAVAAVATSGDSEARLEGRIREAVQAAVHYPPAARMMGVTGRARVLLDYRGGTVDNPTLAQSSGAPLLDTAALAAARDAHYPKPPPDLEGQRLRFLVWVEFRTS